MKIKIPLEAGKVAEGVAVGIESSTERWSEVTLEDGTVIRIKATPISAARIEGQYDNEDNPVYAVRSTTTTVIVSAPEALRKKSH